MEGQEVKDEGRQAEAYQIARARDQTSMAAADLSRRRSSCPMPRLSKNDQKKS